MEQTPTNETGPRGPLRLKSHLLPPYWSRLDAYIFSEVNYPFWLAMAVYNGIFFIHILSEVSGIGSGNFSIPLRLFVLLFISQVPQILLMTCSISFLSGTLFAMRRMSADSEIIAPQSLGISFWRLNRALFAYGLLLAAFVFMINNYAGPYFVGLGNREYGRFMAEEAFPTINEGMNPLGSNMVMYVDSVQEGMLAGLMIINRKDTDEEMYFARRATIYTSREVKLLDWIMCDLSVDDSKDLTFLSGKSSSRRIPIPTDIGGKGFQADDRDLLSTPLLQAMINRQGDQAAPELVYELYRRLYTPLLFVILAMFAVPLAAKHSRLNSGSGIGLSLMMMAVYFMLSKVTYDMVKDDTMSPFNAVALPLIAFFIMGLILQLGKNLWWSQYWRRNQGRFTHLLSRGFGYVRALGGKIRDLFPKAATTSRRGAQTLIFPSKLDLYTMRAYISIFLMVQASFVMLFALVEYTQISGRVRLNNISGDVVVSYFINKLPSMIDETLFISLLISILLLFTVMSKNQEITAIRAGGGSMQRLCMPLVMVGIVISGASFYLDNNFLPYTNRSVQTLRHKIYAKAEATFTRDVWLRSGEDIINYTHYDNTRERLLGVTRYRIEREDSRVKTLERTIWPILAPGPDGWLAEMPARGWKITFKNGQADTATPYTMPVGAEAALDLNRGDLRQRRRKASEFSIREMQEYLQYLKSLGYEESQYETELYAKYAKPLIPLFMMLLAMPLGIQVGRRGTFYGVGVGFGAGLSFLGFFQLFREFGATGLLNPMVAGWSVVVLYGFVALYRFINLE